MGIDASMSGSAEIVETYRRAELRLRLLLLGDGSDVPPLVKGETPRQRVSSEIKHLRAAFDALLQTELESHTELAAAASALESELATIASLRAEANRAPAVPGLLTAVEASGMLGVSPSTLYRAIRRGDVQARRPTDGRRGPIRIPRAEVERLLESDRSRGSFALGD